MEGADYPTNELLEVAPTRVSLGKPHGWPTFGWDNEYGQDQREVNSFQASKFLISNREYFRFVKAGVMSSAATGLNPAGLGVSSEM